MCVGIHAEQRFKIMILYKIKAAYFVYIQDNTKKMSNIFFIYQKAQNKWLLLCKGLCRSLLHIHFRIQPELLPASAGLTLYIYQGHAKAG